MNPNFSILQPNNQILTGGFSPYVEDWQFKHTETTDAIITNLMNHKAITISPKTNQSHIFEIAKACAEKNPWETAKQFKNFRLTDQAHIFEIATMCAKVAPGVTAQQFKNFGLINPNHIFEIAKMCTKGAPGVTAEEFNNFDLTNQDHIFEIAKRCAEGDPGVTAKQFKNFGLTNQDHIFEIAKICAEGHSWTTARAFKNFGLTDQNHIFEIAKVCAERNSWVTVQEFKNFGITDQNHIFEIAKICAIHIPLFTAQEFKNFGITDQNHIFEIAKMCAEINPEIIAKAFKYFGITGQDHIFEIAKICAKKNPLLTAQEFKIFGITDQNHIFEIAKICAEKDPLFTAQEFKNFGLTDQAHALEIAKECAQKTAQTGLYIENFTISDPTILQDHLNIQDPLGVNGLDLLVTPPITKCQVPSIFKLIKIHHASFANSLDDLYKKDPPLAELFISRVVERSPTIVRGGTIPPEYIAFVEALKNLSAQEWIHNLLEWEYKMNQNIPLTVDVLDFVAKHKDSPHFVQLKLALQTHPSFQEVKRIIENGKIAQPFPEKKDFFNLSIQAQREFLCRAQVLRERKALTVANHVLKESNTRDSVDQEVLQMALKLYKSTGIEGSSQTMCRLMTLVKNKKFNTQTHALAIQAISEIEYEPTAPERKTFLIEELKKTQDPLLQKVLLDALALYTFSKNENLDELIGYLQKTSSSPTLDPSLKHSLVFLATILPDERALRIAYDLVNASEWEISGPADLLGRIGDFTLFTFRPSFHDSKNSINRIIGQRLVDLNRDKLEQPAAQSVETFKSNKSSQPALSQLEDNILGITTYFRHIPMQLFLPPGTVGFRGLNQRKGDVLSEASFIDFWLKGTGSSDLSLFDRFEYGTWSKVGQMFTSTTLDYVINHFFDVHGLLMTIPAETLNEQMLRRNIRLECERSIHYVTYSKISHHQISRVFLSTSKHEKIEELAKPSTNSKKIDKIARRNLERAQHIPHERDRKSVKLRDKIVYFKPENSLTNQIEQFMKVDNVRQATVPEIIDETLKRHIMLTNVSDHITDPVLKKAFEKIPEIKPMLVFSDK